MAIHRPSDSLTRCDPGLYSNMYTINSHASFKPQTVAPVKKDTLEISREKLKEEAIQKLHRPIKFVIAQQSFMRIGKYLFLAIAFPPYLAIVELPRWALSTAIPFILSTYAWLWSKVKKTVEPRLDTANHYMEHIRQFFGTMNRRLIPPVERLILHIRHTVQRMLQSAQFVKPKMLELRNQLKSILAIPRGYFRERLDLTRKKIAEIKAWSVEKGEKASELVQETLQRIKQSPQMFLGWGQMQIQNLNEKLAIWKPVWNKPLEKSKNLTDKVIGWTLRHLKNEGAGLKKELSSFFNMLNKHLQPGWQMVKRINRKMSEFFQDKHKRALIFLQKKEKRLKEFSRERWEHLWISRLPSQWQSFLKRIFNHPLTQKLFKQMKDAYCFVALPILQFCQFLLIAAGKGASQVSTNYGKLKDFIIQMGFNLHEYMQMALIKSQRFAFLGLYYFLLGTIMSGVLFSWAINSAGEVIIAFKLSLTQTKKTE